LKTTVEGGGRWDNQCVAYHTSADDADFAFDAAPQRDVGIVVCRVCDFADSRGVLQSNHATRGDEEADQEGQDDACFAPLILHLDLHEFRDGKEEDHQVEKYVDPAVDVDGELEVVAVAFVFSVPLLPKSQLRLFIVPWGSDF
jgi:hypothetical protein